MIEDASKRILSISYFQKAYEEYLTDHSTKNVPYFITEADYLYPQNILGQEKIQIPE